MTIHLSIVIFLPLFAGLLAGFAPPKVSRWIALAITGSVCSRLGRAPVPRVVARNVAGGLIAMGVTYALGGLVGGLVA